MALNPPMSPNGEPYRVEGEYFILKRSGLDFNIQIEHLATYKGSGNLIVTSFRMILINTSHKTQKEWYAFDIPFVTMYNEKFNQPVFGSNYLSGSTTPMAGLIPGNAHFKIWFCNGGAGKFLHSFHPVLDNARQSRKQGSHDTKFNQLLSTGQFMNKDIAYSDPNDPSVIYVVQPDICNTNIQYSSQYAQTYNINQINPQPQPQYSPQNPIMQPQFHPQPQPQPILQPQYVQPPQYVPQQPQYLPQQPMYQNGQQNVIPPFNQNIQYGNQPYPSGPQMNPGGQPYMNQNPIYPQQSPPPIEFKPK